MKPAPPLISGRFGESPDWRARGSNQCSMATSSSSLVRGYSLRKRGPITNPYPVESDHEDDESLVFIPKRHKGN